MFCFLIVVNSMGSSFADELTKDKVCYIIIRMNDLHLVVFGLWSFCSWETVTKSTMILYQNLLLGCWSFLCNGYQVFGRL